jgi:hypothetical protein
MLVASIYYLVEVAAVNMANTINLEPSLDDLAPDIHSHHIPIVEAFHIEVTLEASLDFHTEVAVNCIILEGVLPDRSRGPHNLEDNAVLYFPLQKVISVALTLRK